MKFFDACRIALIFSLLNNFFEYRLLADYGQRSCCQLRYGSVIECPLRRFMRSEASVHIAYGGHSSKQLHHGRRTGNYT